MNKIIGKNTQKNNILPRKHNKNNKIERNYYPPKKSPCTGFPYRFSCFYCIFLLLLPEDHSYSISITH